MNLYWNTQKSVFQHDPTLNGVIWRRVTGQMEFLEGDQVIAPTYNSAKSQEVSLDKVKFGDGYEQVTESGINSVKQVFDLTFLKRPESVARAMDRFLTGEPEGSIYYRRPSEWFYWLPPQIWRKTNNIPIRVRHMNARFTPIAFNAVTLSVTFEEVFDP